MNTRFAETCREDPLALIESEQNIARTSVKDGRTDREIRLACDQDIYLGIFFDGTNNNKFRDEPGKSHSNVARLYEAFPGTNAAQKPPVLLERPGHPRKIVPDRPFPVTSVPPADLPYCRKIYVPGLGTPLLDVGDARVPHETDAIIAIAAKAGVGVLPGRASSWPMVRL